MHHAASQSWELRLDFPAELQFASYIGQQTGFSFEEETQPASSAEAEWRTWWTQLPGWTFDAQLAEALRKEPNTDPFSLLDQAEVRAMSGYMPPDFPDLADRPDLQALCRQHWPTFNAVWESLAGEKFALSEQLQTQLQRVRVDKLVKAATRAAAKRQPHPFMLRVDFVRWPAYYQRVMSDQHLVLGANYVDARYAEALRMQLSTYVAKLV